MGGNGLFSATTEFCLQPQLTFFSLPFVRNIAGKCNQFFFHGRSGGGCGGGVMESAGNNVDGKEKGSIERGEFWGGVEGMRQKMNFKVGNKGYCVQHL